MTVSKLELLVVDDDLHYMFPLVERLESEGYFVESIVNPQDATDWIKKNPAPDLFICDLMMYRYKGQALDQARRTGIELMQEFKILHPDCPIIILTGVLLEELRAETQSITSFFFSKPDGLTPVVRKINELLRRATA